MEIQPSSIMAAMLVKFKCLEGIIKDNADAPDMEEAEDLIVQE